jgi:hypothetical protein
MVFSLHPYRLQRDSGTPTIAIDVNIRHVQLWVMQFCDLLLLMIGYNGDYKILSSAVSKKNFVISIHDFPNTT